MHAIPEDLPETHCDILIIGGGPAGSTAAALLAKRGYSVTLVEKDKHPRFHIGESLLPMNMPLLDQLGVKDEVARIGMIKPGAEFVAAQGDRTSKFRLTGPPDSGIDFAYQVRRSEFDFVLLKNAMAAGASVVETCRITDVDFPADSGVVAKGQDAQGRQHAWRAKFLIDASGRDTFLARKFGIKRRSAVHNSAAVYSHFKGAKRLEGTEEGNISVFFFKHGWFWFIPLSDGTTSVGAVCHPAYVKSRQGSLTEFYEETIALAPALKERLAGAKMEMPPIGTGNYVYQVDRMGGDRYLLLGDSFAFVDPMFSTGVYMAMTGAFRGVEVVETCLRDPVQGAQAMKKLERTMRRSVGIFSWYIHRITTPVLSNLFLGPRNYFRMRDAVQSVLAGSVFGRSRFWLPLFLFKSLYYANSILTLPKSLAARRMRRYAPSVTLDVS